MSFWQIFTDLIKGIGLYKKAMVFFVCLGLVFGLGIFLVYQKAKDMSPPKTGGETNASQNYQVEILPNGNVAINGEKKKKMIIPGQNEDEFLWIVADEPGYQIDTIDVTVKLPKPTSPEEVKNVIYAIHGVGSTSTRFIDNQTIFYQARDVGPAAQFSIVVRMPKGMIKFSIFPEIEAKTWLFLGILLPVLTLIFLAIMLIRQYSEQKHRQPNAILNRPPQNIPSSIVGVLEDGKVSSRELAAILLDLAHRGYLYILVEPNGKFIFNKGKKLIKAKPGELKPYEEILIEKIFPLGGGNKTNQAVILYRVGRHIFSGKIARAYLEIYNEATRAGYFHQNPDIIHLRYRYLGVGLFFLSIIGFFLGAYFSLEPKYALFSWVGMMVASLIIVFIANYMPTRSQKGKETWEEWLAFRAFLAGKAPLQYNENIQDIFERYLPYAIVMHCENEWAGKFLAFPFQKPEWFESTYKNVDNLHDFADQLIPLVEHIGKELDISHEPTVE